ncbi:DMT family transporter [Pseudaminobacter soli (ex Zhang et al. 2022)]|uniref:DMT family transporter n=1 Tax=Pseudaminobacter soli (ex Zhang et al. 2022) TaxID=2831468 RepID=UPI001AEE57A1|nr:DMT family transporter [Pseudaminobacter soli]
MNQISARHEAATPVPAILFVLLTGLFFTVLDTCAKYLVLSGMSSAFVAWTRFAGHTLLAVVLLGGFRNASIFKAASLPMQVLRSLTLLGSTIFNFAALMTLQLAQTAAIFFAVPILVTALAGPLLGEWAGWRRWLAALAGFCGVLVITRPGVGEFGIGHLFALCATLSTCFYVILTRRMSAKETPESLVFYSALAPTVLLLPVVPFTASAPPGFLHLVLLVIIAACGGIGHWFLIKAYSIASTISLAPYPYLQMVWMIAAGYLVFGQLPDGWTLGGAAIIVASGLYIVHREHRLRGQGQRAAN